MRKFESIALAFYLICLAASTLRGAAYLTIPASDSKVTVDGEINEQSEWQKAVRILNFQNAEKGGFALEDTTIWMTHDGQTLYLAMKMHSRILEHSSNMRSRFLARITEPAEKDIKLWNDDSVEIRLLPPWAKKATGFSHFYLIINANSVASSIAPDGFVQDWWRLTTAKATVQDGFWSVELAIPIKALGKELLDNEDLKGWACNFIRFEQNFKEKSSFENILGRSHNDPAFFSRLDLGDNTFPAIKMPDCRNGLIKEITLDAFSESRFTAWWWSSARFLKRNQQYEQNGQAIFPKGESSVKIKTEYQGTGTFEWMYYVIYGAPHKTLFCSPRHSIDENTYPPAMKLFEPENVIAFFLNNQAIKPQTSVTLSPRHGENTLQLNCVTDTLELNLLANESNWPIPMLKWEYFNGTNWLPAIIHKQADSIKLTTPDKKQGTQFRAQFYSKATSLDWAGESLEHFYINENGTNSFFWNANRTSGIDMDTDSGKITLTLIVPNWLEVAGAASRQFDDSSQIWSHLTKGARVENIYRHEEGNSIKNGDEHFRVYTITTDQLDNKIPGWDVSEERIYYRTRCLVLLRALPGASGKTGKITWYMSNNGKTEIPSSRKVIGLPPLMGRQPQKSRITMYLGHFDQINDPKLIEAMFSTVQDAGGTEAFLNNIYSHSDRHGIRHVNFFQMRSPAHRPSEMDMSRIYRKYPQSKATYSSFANLSYLLRTSEVWKDIDQEFAMLRSLAPQIKNLFWDYEYRPFEHYADLSDYTLNLFAEEYHIKGEKLSKEIISEKYFDQWVDFRCKELGRIVPRLREMANRQGIEFTMYMTPDPIWRKQYSVDMKEIAANGGLDHVYFGGTWDHSITERVRRLCRESNTRMSTSVHVCRTDNTGWQRGIILRRLILSEGGGVLLWYEKGFDGLMLQETATVTNLVAEFEEFFNRGKVEAYTIADGEMAYSPENLPSQELKQRILGDVISDLPAMVVYELNDKFLALAINDTATECNVSLHFPKAKGTVSEFDADFKCTASEKFRRKIPPYHYLAFFGEMQREANFRH